jgi:hypothetical protein
VTTAGRQSAGPQCRDASVCAPVVSKYTDHALHRVSAHARSGVELPVSPWRTGRRGGPGGAPGRPAGGAFLGVHRAPTPRAPSARPQSPANIERGSIWDYVGDDRDVLFRYTKTGESATGPGTFSRAARAIQADAPTLTASSTGVASATELSCWARREELQVPTPQLIGRLYRIGAATTISSPGARSELRQSVGRCSASSTLVWRFLYERHRLRKARTMR